MTAEFALPTLVAVALVSAMGLFDWRLKPHVALPVLSCSMLLAAGAAVALAAATAAGFVLGPSRSTILTDWCPAIPLDHQVGAAAGTTSLVALMFASARVSRVVFARFRAVRSVAAGERVSIVTDTRFIAYAIPSKAGCVVVSTGLLASLSPTERRAVFAHERAHLQLGHHRHTLLAEVCVAVLPILRQLAGQLRHATERAADEAAAEQVNSRPAVARAIGTAALGPSASALPALGGGSVARRVEALLWPDREQLASRPVSSLAVVILAIAGLSVGMQLHHFGVLIEHICSIT